MKPQRQARPPAVVPWFICRAHASEFLSLVRGELRHLPRRPVVVLRFPAVRMSYRVERGPGRSLKVFDRRSGALLLLAGGRGAGLLADYRHNAPGELTRC
jgi:hypothetical protein